LKVNLGVWFLLYNIKVRKIFYIIKCGLFYMHITDCTPPFVFQLRRNLWHSISFEKQFNRTYNFLMMGYFFYLFLHAFMSFRIRGALCTLLYIFKWCFMQIRMVYNEFYSDVKELNCLLLSFIDHSIIYFIIMSTVKEKMFFLFSIESIYKTNCMSMLKSELCFVNNKQCHYLILIFFL
jgi:hypothetical protein